MKTYNSIILNLDEILTELEEKEPNKEKIFLCFGRLKEHQELDEEIFTNLTPELRDFMKME